MTARSGASSRSQVQVFFLIDRVKELAAKDPSLKERQPFKALLEHDMKTTAWARQAGACSSSPSRPMPA